MSKMSNLLTYFIIIMSIIWGVYYILIFYGYEQGIIFLKVYTIYYIFLFVTIFFAIIFNSYIGGDDDAGSPCRNFVSKELPSTTMTTTAPIPSPPISETRPSN